MNYFAALTVFLLAGVSVTAAENTCTSCQTTNEGLLETGAVAAKCGALKTYIKCLATTTKDADGCVSPAGFVTKLTAFNAETICTAGDKLTDECSCQKQYWDEGGDCSKITVLTTCLTGKTGNGCDDTKDVAAIKADADKRCNPSETGPNPSETKSSTTKDLNATETTTPGKGTRSTEAIGLITTILISVLGIFFM